MNGRAAPEAEPPAPGPAGAQAASGLGAPQGRVTPVSWRLAAATILAGGAAAGAFAGSRRLGRAVPAAASVLAIGCAIPIAAATRRPPISEAAAARALAETTEPPTFTVLVGARDEAEVLPQLVADVSRQDYRNPDGRPRFELIVVDDRSTDGSGDAVLRAARDCGIAAVTRVVRREGRDLPDGKGAALTAAQPDICRGDVVLVLDADARIAPEFLRLAAGYFAAGACGVTARRRILDAQSGRLAAAQNDEQTLDGQINRGRWALGGCSEFRGDGIMVRRDLLAAAGGWRASALTEDIDLSSRVAAVSGERVAWAIDVEVWEEPVRDLRGLWRQRLRWAEGAFRRAFEHGPAVLRSPHLSAGAKLDFATYVGQLAVPPLVAGAAAAAVIHRRGAGLISILGAYLGLSAALGWDALRWERGPGGGPLQPGERLARTVRLSLFNGLWLLVVPRALVDLALRRGPIRYVKMDHAGQAEPDWSARPGATAASPASDSPGGPIRAGARTVAGDAGPTAVVTTAATGPGPAGDGRPAE